MNQIDRMIATEIMGKSTTSFENEALPYSSDMNLAIEVLNKLDELSRSWNSNEQSDDFNDWECKKEWSYRPFYSLAKFSRGDYPGLPTFWGVLETRTPFRDDEDESHAWLSESKSPAMAICLAALFLKTGETPSKEPAKRDEKAPFDDAGMQEPIGDPSDEESIPGTQEKTFLVPESRIKKLRDAAFREGYSQGPWTNPESASADEAEAACMEQELPEWATHIVENLDGPLDYGLYSIGRDLEIKK